MKITEKQENTRFSCFFNSNTEDFGESWISGFGDSGFLGFRPKKIKNNRKAGKHKVVLLFLFQKHFKKTSK